jgi:pimeloyl-ACP methyl ester carboxylesterase
MSSTALPPEPLPAYQPRRLPWRQMLSIRGGRIAVTRWGESTRAPIVLLHGWMDCAAAYQLLADCLPEEWPLAALDWRGYGHSDDRADHYWLPENLADLEAVLAVLSPHAPACLVGHSLGGTVASVYAGVRPERLAWLVNIEGFGLGRGPLNAAERMARWLDEQATLAPAVRYDSLDELARRILRRHQGLRPDRARFLAWAWSRERDGHYELAADPKHRLLQPLRLRREDIEECWARIRCPVLMLLGSQSESLAHAGGQAQLARWAGLMAGLELATIEGAGHMVQHEQPERAASHIERFVRRLAAA